MSFLFFFFSLITLFTRSMHEAAKLNSGYKIKEEVFSGKTTEALVNGYTPLHIACYYGQEAIMRRLFFSGADPAILSKKKETAFIK